MCSKSAGSESKRERLGDGLHAPRFGDRLEPSDEQLAGIFLEVAAAVRVAQHRHRRRQRLDVFGDDVEVFCGVQRDDGIDSVGEFAGPHPGTVDDCVGADVACIGADTDSAAALDHDLVDLDVLDDFHAATACALGESLSGVDRVRLSVVWKQHPADEIVDVRERHECPGCRRR